MRLAIISASTFPACLPSSKQNKAYYGSESMNAVLAQAFIDHGHEVAFFAPVGSTFLGDFHPLRWTQGNDAGDDRLETLSLEKGISHHFLGQYDFIIDGSKRDNNVEELKLYHHFNRFCCYRSGFNDFYFPERLEGNDKHLVTHCNYFQGLFKQAGFEADVAHFGIDGFWSQEPSHHAAYFLTGRPDYLEQKGYFLFPHRPNFQKGIDHLIKLAQLFPNEIFVVSTSSPLPDHKASMMELAKNIKEKSLSNLRIVDCPQGGEYHYYRRELMRNAKAILSPFVNTFGADSIQQYHDTGGLVTMEALSTGVPAIVTRSRGSEELLGHQEDQGVVFVDGLDAMKLAIRYTDFQSLHPVPVIWTIDNWVKDYMSIFKKYM